MPTIKLKVNYPKFKYAGISSTYTDAYLLEGYSEAAALAAIVGAADPYKIINGVILNSVEYDLSRRGKPSDNSWEGVVSYKHSSATQQFDIPANENDEKLSFSFSGPSTFFTKAIAQDNFGTTARDVGLAINVSNNGDVEGMDVGIPSSGFQVRIKQDLGANAAAINTKVKELRALLHTKNDDTFRGLEAGDCLLTQFSGEQRNDGLFDMIYDFAVELNQDYTSDQFDTGRVQFTIGRKIKGFELIWVMYEQFEDTTAKVMVPQALGVYVADVFEDGDFSTIGITV